MLEKKLQDFLTRNNGLNLLRIDPELVYLDKEYSFRGGRVDILAVKNGFPVAIELKAKNYSSSQVAGQIINYLNFLKNKNGSVYLVAPKIKPGIISTLREYSNTRFFEFDEKLHFYEINEANKNKKFFFFKIPEYHSNTIQEYVRAPIARLMSKGIQRILKL